MQAGDPLGQVEFAVLDAVNRGAFRARCTARKIKSPRERPSERTVHEALQRCEHEGLLRSERDGSGRLYQLTAAGRAQLRADRRFRLVLAGLLARSGPNSL
jgi:DNA-binding PadR family transcriptional regulator